MGSWYQPSEIIQLYDKYCKTWFMILKTPNDSYACILYLFIIENYHDIHMDPEDPSNKKNIIFLKQIFGNCKTI